MYSSKVIPMTVFFVVCNDCGFEGTMAFSNKDADREAEQDGWLRIWEQHYCPEHKKRHEEFAQIVQRVEHERQEEEKQKKNKKRR